MIGVNSLNDASDPVNSDAMKRSRVQLPSRRHIRRKKWQSNAKRRRHRRGASVVEFAAVVPVFFLVVFGLIEVGRMIMVYQCLTNAAREGCRTAALATTTDPNQVKATTRRFLTSAIPNTEDVRISLPENVSASTESGTELKVGVEVDYKDVNFLPLHFLGLNPTLRYEVTQLRE